MGREERNIPGFYHPYFVGIKQETGMMNVKKSLLNISI